MTISNSYLNTILAQLPVDVKDKPGYPLQVAQLELLQEAVNLLHEISKKLDKEPEPMKGSKKPMTGGKGKMKKRPNCGKPYAGEKCPCAGKGGKPKVMKRGAPKPSLDY